MGHAGTKAPRLDTDKVHSIEREQTYYRVIGAIALAPFEILQRALEAALPSNGRLGMQHERSKRGECYQPRPRRAEIAFKRRALLKGQVLAVPFHRKGFRQPRNNSILEQGRKVLA